MQKWRQETELETQLGFSPEGKGGVEFNLLIGKATLEVQAGGEKRKIVREKLSESLTDFIKLIDDLVAAVERDQEESTGRYRYARPRRSPADPRHLYQATGLA